jgi:putative intracellular protease/amidase
MSKWTLVLAYPDCILFEVIPAAQGLERLFPVRVSTADGLPFWDHSGFTIKPDCRYQEVETNECACVLIPGGNPDRIATDPEAARIVNAVKDPGGVVAGICAGVAVLGLVGALVGRRIAHNYAEDDVPADVRVDTDPLGEIRRTTRTASVSTPA